jgi:hypothetical protein
MKKLLFGSILALALAAPAGATLQIAANFGGVLFFCADQQACDTNPLVGQLGITNQIINGVEILGSSQFATIGVNNFLNTSSFQIINHNLFNIGYEVAVGGTGFLGPVSSYAASGSGTWQNAAGSDIDLSYYGDAANGQGADTPNDLPGLLLASFSDVAVGPADAFAFNTSGAFNAPNPFSMSLGTDGTLAAWNGQQGQETTLVGRSQTILTTQLLVPEPGTLALLGVALLGLGFMRRKRA